VTPNDAATPDPDSYAGSVDRQLRDQAVRRVREEHRGDAAWHHDPDHRLDEEAAARDAHRQADQFTAEQHDRLVSGVVVRGAPEIAGTNYLGIPHDTLHEMVNNDIDPGMVDRAGAAWNKVGMTLQDIGDRLTKASAANEQAWSGNAAEGARAFTSGVATWSENTAQGALLSSNNMATQSEAASTVRSAVPPPMKYNVWDEITDLLSAPDPVSGVNTVRAKLRQQQELHRQAADAVASYDQTLSHSSSTMPAFAAPPAFAPDAHDPVVPPGGDKPPPGRTQAGGNPPQQGGSPSPGGPDGGPAPGSRSPLPDDSRVDRPGSTGTGPARADAGSPGQLGARGADGLGNGRGPGTPGFGALGGAPVSGRAPGGPGGGGERGGSGGPGGMRGIEGRVAGPGAGALAAGQATLGRGGTGARGAAGSGELPVGAGGTGRKGEDEEHERPSYLVGEDPNVLFGIDEEPAPPVIE
jgi:hypothetical protein